MINPLFLAETVLTPGEAGGLFAALVALGTVFFIIILGIYIFMSFAFMSIARKAKYSTPGIAWIPLVGPAIITSKTAEMHWWPILFLIGLFVPVIGGPLLIAFAVFFTIWLWKTLEKIGQPGWFSILIVVLPIIGLVFLGIAAWSKENSIEQRKKRRR